MKPELMYLLWAVALTVVQMLICVSGATLQVGLPKLTSNRDNMPPFTGWVGRSERAHRNMLENLALFVALVFLVSVTGKSNQMTVLGAQLFFWARLAYAVIYLIGIPWLRTGVWLVSIVGLLLIFLQLL